MCWVVTLIDIVTCNLKNTDLARSFDIVDPAPHTKLTDSHLVLIFWPVVPIRLSWIGLGQGPIGPSHIGPDNSPSGPLETSLEVGVCLSEWNSFLGPTVI